MRLPPHLLCLTCFASSADVLGWPLVSAAVVTHLVTHRGYRPAIAPRTGLARGINIHVPLDEPWLVPLAYAGDQQPDRLATPLLSPFSLANTHPFSWPRGSQRKKIPVLAAHSGIRPCFGLSVANDLLTGASVELPRAPDERFSLILGHAIGQAASPVILPRLIQDRYGNGSVSFQPSADQLNPQISQLGSRDL